ncbi:MAG: YggS family pyridoxal phosphate-dependent enzyme [Hydrogenophilus sp.]|nr:YggS family pyridoxal phosphate-dependent enzyme [Hydrogenophilus sp.]
MQELGDLETVVERLRRVQAEVAERARAAGRDPAGVTLVAVSKGQPVSAIEAAWKAGQRVFGESYVQEAKEKQEALAERGVREVEWHFVGPIQRNKTRAIAERFDWVHSLDRVVVAKRLSEQRPEERGKLRIFVEVNTSGEQSKRGVHPEEVLGFVREIAELPRLEVVGLMTIPEEGPEEVVRARFRLLAELRAWTVQAGFGLWGLSMGMSGDWHWAVAEGATHVRIGTAIFGERPRQRTRE